MIGPIGCFTSNPPLYGSNYISDHLPNFLFWFCPIQLSRHCVVSLLRLSRICLFSFVISGVFWCWNYSITAPFNCQPIFSSFCIYFEHFVFRLYIVYTIQTCHQIWLTDVLVWCFRHPLLLFCHIVIPKQKWYCKFIKGGTPNDQKFYGTI